MTIIFLCAILAVSPNEFTLADLISLERLENGADTERLVELDSALEGLPNFRFAPTPDEFRMVAEGLRHKNHNIRAASASLLEKLSKQSSKIVAEDLVRKRQQPLGDEFDDEAWFRSVYYLVYRPEIPGADAFQAFQTHFKIYRQCGTDWYRRHRPAFDLKSHLQTRDLDTLNYALSRQIDLLQNPRRVEPLDDQILFRVDNIAEHCPNQHTRDLAKNLRDLIGLQKVDN